MRAYEFYWGAPKRENSRREPAITLKGINRAKEDWIRREAEKRWKIANLYPAMYGNRDDADTDDLSDKLDAFDNLPQNKSPAIVRDMADEEINRRQGAAERVEDMARSQMRRMKL